MRTSWSVALVVFAGLSAPAVSSCGLFEDGYEAGYNSVDFVLSAAAERQAVLDDWRSACTVPAESAFSTASDLEAADRHCRDRSPSRDRVTLCTDPGRDPGSHPADCVTYQSPIVIPMDSDYRCPAGVDEALLCLCCGGDRGQSCGLRGDSCAENADCCDGGCSIDTSGVGECL